MLDKSGPVRAGEELDTEALGAFLAAHGYPGPLRIEQFPGGFSNLTYLVAVGEQEMVLRRPPRGAAIRGGHDMLREYRLLQALHPVYPRVPRPLAASEADGFYLMERVRGQVLRRGGDASCTPERMAALSETLVDLLAELHALPLEGGLAGLGKPEGYVERQVLGWNERYRKARTDDVEGADFVMDWLAEHRPAESGAALIHNDFKYDNLILDGDRVLAVLDWEMATVGDPLMDLGTTLGYWVEEGDPAPLRQLGFGPTFLPGNLTRAQLAERYCQRRGLAVQGLAFYYVFGLFKIAVICQQIYARYRQGLTTDPRFSGLGMAVQLMVGQAARSARSGAL